MNEPAIRLEEQIISLFPGMETLVCHGWILKKMETCRNNISGLASTGSIFTAAIKRRI